MNYSQALSYIAKSAPMGSRLGLRRMEELLGLLDYPQSHCRFVHIAGTNGKGSTAAMTEAVLRSAGYRTGLYTSPHFRRFNERIKLDGRDISDENFASTMELLSSAAERMEEKPTEFEIITALAFLCFKLHGCDVAVLEVGLGGRLDATNVIKKPECCIITHIAEDHTEILGNSIGLIAREKAGIIKPGRPVVMQSQSEEAQSVVRARCLELGSPLSFTRPEELKLLNSSLSGQNFDYGCRKNLMISLAGTYQLQNAAAVCEAADVLNSTGFSISEDALRKGLSGAVWPGRFQLLRESPPVIVDGAHNEDGALRLAESLRRYFPGRKISFIMGVLRDKDYVKMLEALLPLAKIFYTVTPSSERALGGEALAMLASERCESLYCGSVKEGLDAAFKAMEPEDMLCICGSLYQVGEVQDYFEGIADKQISPKGSPLEERRE